MKNQKRIEHESSRTAAYTCTCRAASYLEKKAHLQSGDYIAVELLPKFIKYLIGLHILNLKGRISPTGIYPYVIARTKFIDEVFEKSVNNTIEQVLILGAGFDSRAIRFAPFSHPVIIFEVDTSHTLEAKKKQLKKRHIPIPENSIYVPVDFEKEDYKEKLHKNGFARNHKNLVIMEGLIMYLSPNTVNETFQFIQSHSAPGSLIVFDYVHSSVLRQEGKHFGEKAIYRRVRKDREKWIFGIEADEIEAFLNQYNLKLLEHLDSAALEQKYFTDINSQLLTKVNGTHCLVLAKTDS